MLQFATILFIISQCWRMLWTTCRCHTNLHNFFICQKGKRSQLSCWDCLRWVGRWLRTPTDVNGTFGWYLLVRSQFEEALPDANHLLQSAITAHIVSIAEWRVLLCQTKQKFLLIVCLFLTWTVILSHSFFPLFSSKNWLYIIFFGFNNYLYYLIIIKVRKK